MPRQIAIRPIPPPPCGCAWGAGAGAAAAAPPSQLVAAREVLVLSDARLELMKEVMASKWFSRAPIQDLAQEEKVIETAVAEARALGVAAGPTATLFEAEIGAAKEVQLGWGSHWLFYGAPPELAAPELTALRRGVRKISAQIVAALPRLIGISALPAAESRVESIAEKVVLVKYLSVSDRAGLSDALTGIRPASGAHTSA